MKEDGSSGKDRGSSDSWLRPYKQWRCLRLLRWRCREGARTDTLARGAYRHHAGTRDTPTRHTRPGLWRCFEAAAAARKNYSKGAFCSRFSWGSKLEKKISSEANTEHAKQQAFLASTCYERVKWSTWRSNAKAKLFSNTKTQSHEWRQAERSISRKIKYTTGLGNSSKTLGILSTLNLFIGCKGRLIGVPEHLQVNNANTFGNKNINDGKY